MCTTIILKSIYDGVYFRNFNWWIICSLLPLILHLNGTSSYSSPSISTSKDLGVLSKISWFLERTCSGYLNTSLSRDGLEPPLSEAKLWIDTKSSPAIRIHDSGPIPSWKFPSKSFSDIVEKTTTDAPSTSSDTGSTLGFAFQLCLRGFRTTLR